MAATERPIEEQQTQGFHEFLDSVLDPPFVDTFRGKLEGGVVRIQIFDRATRTMQSHSLRGMFPFMTLYELKLAIYNLMSQADKALPEFTFVGKAVPPGKKIQTTDYAWNLPATPTEPVNLLLPTDAVKAAAAPDMRFTESSGERRILGITDRERITLEDMYLKSLKAVPTFQVYFYDDLVATSDVTKPISERDWNGRLYPYFPRLSVGADTPTADHRRTAKRFLKAFLWRRQFYARLEDMIEAGEPLLPLKLTGVRYMRLLYAKPKAIPGVDAMFYDTAVTGRRPYMRLLPTEASAISKIHLTADGKPDLDDPRLLLQWSQERSPTPDRDFALAKILYRKTSGTIPPLYLSLRLFDDGTADITIEPPRGVRKLDPRSELNELEGVLRDGLQGFSYLRELPTLGTGMFIFGMSVKGAAEAFTTASLRKRLGLFKSVFQEIPTLPGERPVLMMRYKLMSNYLNEDRIQSFITQVINRKLVRGDALLTDLVELVADEFQLDPVEAKRRVAQKLQQSGDVIMADQETKEYIFNSNVGTDIAIFAQHPLYAFHLYRVDSVESLKRIVTFLSLLFSKSAAEVNVPEEAVEAVESTPTAPSAETAAEAEAPPTEEHEEDEFKNVVNADEEDEFKNVTEEAVEAQASAVQPAEDVATAEAMPDYLQDLMFDVDAEPTIAEAEGLAGPLKAPEEEEAAAEAMERFRALAGDDEEAVAEDAGAAGAVVAAVQPKKFVPKKAAAAAPLTAEEPEPVDVRRPGKKKDKALESFFSDKLMETDKRLFDYTRTHPSLKKYVSQCGANLTRQPAVLSQEQYERMLDEYRDAIDSGEMTFYVFPLTKDKKKDPYDPKPGAEYYTLMRYGSSDQVQNYYLCCRYFCTRDEILVREKELQGTRLRRPVPTADGSMRTTKAPMTCPFCEGKVVKDRRFPGVNETILERTIKPGTPDRRHLYINFLGKVYHPEGFRLPCCFTDDQPIRIGHPAFPESGATTMGALALGDDEEGAAAAAPEVVEERAPPEGDLVSYEETLLKAKFAYIVGAEKFPLEGPERKFAKVRERSEEPRGPPKINPPQIGILPQVLNEFFAQEPGQLVSRTFNPQKLRPGAQGFLRIGVENRVRYKADSFLAAVAPFFGKNSVKSFKDFLADIIQPRVFLAMNFGNFALEMYDPVTARPRPEDAGKIREWARASLGIRRVTTNNEELIIRAFMAYRYFQVWLASDQTTKEYRQFAHLFAQPGILQTGVRRVAETGVAVPETRRPGILFIVLEILKTGELRVRCPPYPVSKEAFARADIGFLLHHWSGVWEPLFYVDNRSLGERDLNTFFLSFSNGQYSRWPKIVQQRVQEYASQCAAPSGARGIYTSLSGINSTKIAPITTARTYLTQEEGVTLQGLIRDSYNHVAALVLADNSPTAVNPGALVAVPVVDDGVAMVDLDVRLIMDWDDYEPASIAAVVDFYRKYVSVPKFPKSYAPLRAMRSLGTGQIVALQLANGLYVPVAPVADVPSEVILPQPESEVAEMEWSINRRLAMGAVAGEAQEVPPGEEQRLRIKEFNEVFEHLRLTFSNWLATQERGGEFRTALEKTIFRRDIPLFEKRKRLEIMLTSVIEPWLEETDEEAPRTASLLRVDCRLRSESECGGMCSWSTEGGQCLLHVPRSTPSAAEDEELASGAEVLLRRLIEELLRYAGRRQQIFDQRVSQLATLDNPIKVKDQYILPEKSAAWSDLLRLDWAKDKTEEPRYLEEMSRAPGVQGTGEAAVPAEPLATIEPLTALPETLRTILGPDDPKTGRLRLYPSPTETINPFLGLFGAKEADVGVAPASKEFSDAALTALVKKGRVPVIQYDLRVDPPIITGKRLPIDRDVGGYPVFVIRSDAAPSLLVLDPEAPAALKKEDLPEELVKEFQEAKKVFGVKLV